MDNNWWLVKWAISSNRGFDIGIDARLELGETKEDVIGRVMGNLSIGYGKQLAVIAAEKITNMDIRYMIRTLHLTEEEMKKLL